MASADMEIIVHLPMVIMNSEPKTKSKILVKTIICQILKTSWSRTSTTCKTITCKICSRWDSFQVWWCQARWDSLVACIQIQICKWCYLPTLRTRIQMLSNSLLVSCRILSCNKCKTKCSSLLWLWHLITREWLSSWFSTKWITLQRLIKRFRLLSVWCPSSRLIKGCKFSLSFRAKRKFFLTLRWALWKTLSKTLRIQTSKARQRTEQNPN